MVWLRAGKEVPRTGGIGDISPCCVHPADEDHHPNPNLNHNHNIPIQTQTQTQTQTLTLTMILLTLTLTLTHSTRTPSSCTSLMSCATCICAPCEHLLSRDTMRG